MTTTATIRPPRHGVKCRQAMRRPEGKRPPMHAAIAFDLALVAARLPGGDGATLADLIESGADAALRRLLTAWATADRRRLELLIADLRDAEDSACIPAVSLKAVYGPGQLFYAAWRAALAVTEPLPLEVVGMLMVRLAAPGGPAELSRLVTVWLRADALQRVSTLGEMEAFRHG